MIQQPIQLPITPATTQQRTWAAQLMASSEPWTTLGLTIEKCVKACTDSELQLFIANHQGEPCGFILIHPRGLAGSPYIKSVCVAEDRRKLGIGKALMSFAEKRFQNESIHIFLCVSSFNTSAQRFYEDRGYTQVGEFKDYLLIGESELLLHKLLT